ncbi:MAG: hydrogenase maturation protease [Desulfamplus sp.]|nr:hydrogenase maturation protease [Desulfamplus sp.]
MFMEKFIKPILIFGCGNTLFGDDGFGPEVVDRLNSNYNLPEYVVATDAGTGIQGVLFDIALSSEKPSALFIVDTVLLPDRSAGELFELDINQIPEKNVSEFSLHQFPSVNLLQELQQESGIQVRVFVVQAKSIPEYVEPGLSQEVYAAIEPACKWLIDNSLKMNNS